MKTKSLLDTLKLNFENRFGQRLKAIRRIERITCLLLWLVLPLGTILISAYLSYRILEQNR